MHYQISNFYIIKACLTPVTSGCTFNFHIHIWCVQVMYGGRVIDDFDRRVVRTYMDEYMGEFLFDSFQPFHFYKDKHVDYFIPSDGIRDDYIGITFFNSKFEINLLKAYFVVLIFNAMSASLWSL